jgi:hypothetical protein
LVAIFHQGERVASHPRSAAKHQTINRTRAAAALPSVIGGPCSDPPVGLPHNGENGIECGNWLFQVILFRPRLAKWLRFIVERIYAAREA